MFNCARFCLKCLFIDCLMLTNALEAYNSTLSWTDMVFTDYWWNWLLRFELIVLHLWPNVLHFITSMLLTFKHGFVVVPSLLLTVTLSCCCLSCILYDNELSWLSVNTKHSFVSKFCVKYFLIDRRSTHLFSD